MNNTLSNDSSFPIKTNERSQNQTGQAQQRLSGPRVEDLFLYQMFIQKQLTAKENIFANSESGQQNFLNNFPSLVNLQVPIRKI